MFFIQVAPDKISPETFPGLREWIDKLNAIRANPVRVVMVAEDDIPRGVMVYEPGNVLYILVLPDERRGGVGTELIKFAKANSPGGVLSTHVHPRNVEGICFLHSRGFAITAWYTSTDDIRYLRMTNHVEAVYTPPEEGYLEHFIRNVPIFLATAEGNF